MKVYCLFLIPRHVSVILVFLCSCHFFVLMNWVGVENRQFYTAVADNDRMQANISMKVMKYYQFYGQSKSHQNVSSFTNKAAIRKVENLSHSSNTDSNKVSYVEIKSENNSSFHRENKPKVREAQKKKINLAKRNEFSKINNSLKRVKSMQNVRIKSPRTITKDRKNKWNKYKADYISNININRVNLQQEPADHVYVPSQGLHLYRVGKNGSLQLLQNENRGKSNYTKDKVNSHASVTSGNLLNYSDTTMKEFYDRPNKKRTTLQFEYIINPVYACQKTEDSPSGTYLIVTVHSHASHKSQRDAIRNTWGRITKQYDNHIPVQLIFILGIDSKDRKNSRGLLFKEAQLYRDILLGNFTDSYDNLSVKSLFALKWVSEYCTSAKYVLKTDDDTYVNTTSLLYLLTANNYTVLGSLNHDSKVMRSGLWKVPIDTFPFDRYPDYCTGCVYLISTSIISDLLQRALSTPLIPVEDAYITGILVTLIGYKCVNDLRFPQWHIGTSRDNICKLLRGSLLALHNVPDFSMYDIYNTAKSQSSNCTVKIS